MKDRTQHDSKDMKPAPSKSFCQRWHTALVTKVMRKMRISDSIMVMGNKYSKRVPSRQAMITSITDVALGNDVVEHPFGGSHEDHLVVLHNGVGEL